MDARRPHPATAAAPAHCLLLAALALLLSPACGAPAERAPVGWPELEATPRPQATSGPDAHPSFALAFVYPDGERVPVEGLARAYVPFRDGVAMVDLERRLWLVSNRGARRVLAHSSGTDPVRGPGGELLYVAGYGQRAELHRLGVDGQDEVLGSGFASASVLSPLADGRVAFVAARSGGVAGLWLADGAGARCLTNCDLGPAPWGDAFQAPPGEAAAIELAGEQLRYRGHDGVERSVALRPAQPAQPEPVGTRPHPPAALEAPTPSATEQVR